MTGPHSFLGIPIDGDAARLADNLTVREEPDGLHVVRVRTERVVALRCRCTHLERQHGTDRRGRPTCYGGALCGCASWTPERSNPT